MESKQFIKVAVENEFETTNDRNMVTAFLYRRVLNINPLDVCKELKLSRNQVNNLTRSIDYRRLQNKEISCGKFLIDTQLAKRDSSGLALVFHKVMLCKTRFFG